MNKLLTYAVMLDTLILVYPQFLIMLIELQKVLSQELSCFCSKATTVLSVWTLPKTVDMSLLHFIVLKINSMEMYVYFMYSKYILYRSVCPLVILYIGWGCQSPYPQEIRCFKWKFCDTFVRFRFARLFQERIHGVKRDLSVIPLILQNLAKLKYA
jgi:hypothetical protein